MLLFRAGLSSNLGEFLTISDEDNVRDVLISVTSQPNNGFISIAASKQKIDKFTVDINKYK